MKHFLQKLSILFFMLLLSTSLSAKARKTIKKKVKKNAKKTERIFKTKYNNRNYSSIRIRIWDKHKHKLYDSTRTITWRS